MSTLTIPDLTSDPAHPELTEIFREHWRLTYRTAYAVTDEEGRYTLTSISPGAVTVLPQAGN